MPEFFREKQGQSRADNEESEEHREFSAANQGEDEDSHEDSNGDNPYRGSHEKRWDLMVFQVKLLLDETNHRHEGTDRTNPTAIDTTEEEGTQKADDKENQPDLRFSKRK